METGIILQARIGSRRLPGKVLKTVGKRVLLEHIIFRLTFLQHPVNLVLATSELPRDDVLADFCEERSLNCFRGDERDVLDRFYQCAFQHQFRQIIRLTGDNPFYDIEELDRLINLHIKKGADYSHSLNVLPVGSGAEIFTFKALERSFFYGTKPNHREHVNEYILENPQQFLIATLKVPFKKNRPDIRLTIDTKEDYRLLCSIAEGSRHDYLTTEEAIRLYLETKDNL